MILKSQFPDKFSGGELIPDGLKGAGSGMLTYLKPLPFKVALYAIAINREL